MTANGAFLRPSTPYAEYSLLAGTTVHQLQLLASLGPGGAQYKIANPDPPGVPMQRGSAVDCLLTRDWDTFTARYVYAPTGPEELPATFLEVPAAPEEMPEHFRQVPEGLKLTTKAGKAWAALMSACGMQVFSADDFGPDGLKLTTNTGKAWVRWATAAGRTVLSQEHYTAAINVAEAVRAYGPAAELLAGAIPQVACCWTCRDTGLQLRGLLDWHNPAINMVVELKTAADSSPEAFSAAAHRYRYHWQAVQYMDAVEEITGTRPDFRWVVVASDAPHRPEVYRLPMAEEELAREELLAAKTAWRACEASGAWPLSTGAVQDLTFKSWAFRGQ